MNSLRNTILFVIAFAAGVAAQSSPTVSKDLSDLASAERAFAAETVKVGFRDGFIKYFADDGIGFGPHPERTREKLMKSPPATGPRKVIFNWAPMFGDISDAGDLGYTTGPVLYTDLTDSSKPPRHGIYFSVWQKQSDGTWKVAIDMGVDTPNAVGPIDTIFTAAKPVGPRRPNPMKGTPSDDYRKLDWSLWGSIAKTSPSGGYGSYLDKEFRVHRKGMMPATDFASLAAMLHQTKFEFIDGKVASSGDLAFTYGKYSTVNEPSGDETGYYVHVWRRDTDSKWRLVVDVQNPLPKTDK
jgi:ketosteroid isomerase-like protein